MSDHSSCPNCNNTDHGCGIYKCKKCGKVTCYSCDSSSCCDERGYSKKKKIGEIKND